MFGAKVGRRCHVYPGVKFWAPWNLVIGDDVGIGDGAFIYAMNKILIGDRSIVSQEVFLCGGTHDYRKASHPLQSFPISIGSDCWLAARVFVHPGVAIPDGVVVGACSVVTSDLPKWSVCTGNPCKYIKPRDYDN
jgi:putative colanic acid biosynthesis acetyltransferase WcaF